MDTFNTSRPPSLALPWLCRDAAITFGQLADAYMAQYAGRDPSRVSQLAWWLERFGDRLVQDIVDDDVHAAIELLASGRGRYYAGLDADGRPVMRAKSRLRAPATLNTYHATLSALFKWAQRQRLTPRDWKNPCRVIPLRKVDNTVVRFLSEQERTRLLTECRCAHWEKLYLLALLALTTGARRGELMNLRWGDVDFSTSLASVRRTKNNGPRLLPLTPAVLDELRRFAGSPQALIFASKQRPAQPMTFDAQWKKALRRANVRNFRFHDLRHSTASALAQNGATLLEIADVLGHRQLQVGFPRFTGRRC